SVHEIYDAVAATVQELTMDNWMKSRSACEQKGIRSVYYFSAEFLMGRALSNNLINTLIKQNVIDTLQEIGIDYNIVENQEPDAALGNGGLGRLAACFLDSLATLNYSARGYGIRYKYGMFEQHIEDGYQVEYPDNWLIHRDPWQMKRSDLAVEVKFGGYVTSQQDAQGNSHFNTENAEIITATPYDTPIIGYDTNTVNTLRLWEASSPDGFDLQLFNDMHYNRAVERKNSAETVSCVLYPNDSGPSGKTLRLKQQYFFCSASLQDIVKKYVSLYGENFDDFAKYHVIQLNDTHPVVAIPELMRILMDEHNIGWDKAWAIVTQTFAYTNHTILAEALEKWPIDIFQGLLPRIYQIIDEINRRLNIILREQFPGDYAKQNRMSIIANGMIHMAWLAIHASFSVNGVARLHTEILKNIELKDWADLYSQKFNNKTNGITQRRWLLNANPRLSRFISERIGDDWKKDFSLLRSLEKFADDEKSLQELADIKHKNKEDLADWLKITQNASLNPESIFDIQIKRLHEYKRQLLNILHILYLYNRLLDEPDFNPPARTYIFGAKAASGYRRAKSIIKLINSIADRINNDNRVRGKLHVVFVENYRVTAAEKIFPASDVSEQISTAGKEASGTGNMKFMINGALTIGTLDGANIEIVEEAGNENAFIFGLTSDEIAVIEREHSYNPQKYIDRNPALAKVLNQLIDGTFDLSGQLFRELYDSLIFGVEGQRPDVYYVLADFDEYCIAQEKVAQAYTDRLGWAKKALLNIARSGKFSSDRTIEDYVADIWKLEKINI
ncbi:MAG: glycogen/starch/alpha-glucan phosphorylase, partial [Spirochaetales bacterium]